MSSKGAQCCSSSECVGSLKLGDFPLGLNAESAPISCLTCDSQHSYMLLLLRLGSRISQNHETILKFIQCSWKLECNWGNIARIVHHQLPLIGLDQSLRGSRFRADGIVKTVRTRTPQ